MEVMPSEPERKQVCVPVWEESGGVFWILYLVIGFLVVDFRHIPWFNIGMAIAALITCVIVTAPVFVVLYGVRYFFASVTERAKVNKGELARVTGEAEALTRRLKGILYDASSLKTQLQANLNASEDWLDHAETEYRASAFAPFWDAVEQSALALGNYNNNIQRLNSMASNYYGSLRGRSHSFPVFDESGVPDSTAQIRRFQKVLRQGQTDFKFANIWEHRATRDAVVAGFRSLGDAVNGLEGALASSVGQLRDTISSGLREVRDVADWRLTDQNRLIDNQNRLIGDQNSMIDNIQRGRRPW
jgi:hypothetical protein